MCDWSRNVHLDCVCGSVLQIARVCACDICAFNLHTNFSVHPTTTTTTFMRPVHEQRTTQIAIQSFFLHTPRAIIEFIRRPFALAAWTPKQTTKSTSRRSEGERETDRERNGGVKGREGEACLGGPSDIFISATAGSNQQQQQHHDSNESSAAAAAHRLSVVSSVAGTVIPTAAAALCGWVTNFVCLFFVDFFAGRKLLSNMMATETGIGFELWSRRPVLSACTEGNNS